MLWMLPPREAMQSEIRDGELHADARGVESVRGRGLTGGGGQVEEEGGLQVEKDGGGAVGAAAQRVGQWVGGM